MTSIEEQVDWPRTDVLRMRWIAVFFGKSKAANLSYPARSHREPSPAGALLWLPMGAWAVLCGVYHHQPQHQYRRLFPTRATLAEHDVPATMRYFEDRFHHDIKQSRRAMVAITGNQFSGLGRNRNTNALGVPFDREIRKCLPPDDPRLEAPLGRAATIVDAVPWKFANWSKVKGDKTQLLESGRRYLLGTLENLSPKAIIASGGHAQSALRELFELEQSHRGTLSINGHEIPWFSVVAPTAFGDRFRNDMEKIRSEIQRALEP